MYNKEWAERNNRSTKTRSRARMLVRGIKKTKGVVFILDMGCGAGVLVDSLTVEGYVAVGMDYSEDVIGYARTHNLGIFRKADARHSPAGVFDMVIISHLLQHNEGSALWLTEERHPMTPNGVQMIIKRLLRRAEVSSSKKGTHILRHTAAINFLRNGGALTSLQIMLGHSKIQTTMIYLTSLGAEDMLKDHELASPVDRLGIR